MRVAMYYPWIYVRGGIERTILELARRSRHDWTVFTSHFRPEDTFPEYRSLDVRILGSVSVKRDVGSVGRACLSLLKSSYNWDGFDAVMVSCDGIGNLVALRSRNVPLLCLCHTPLKIGYDQHANARWKGMFRPGLVSRAAVSAFMQIDRLAWKRYQRVFCVSAEVESRLRAAGVVREGQTEVLHPGVDFERMAPTGGRDPYFFLPGRIMWSKNVELGLKAFVDFKARSEGDAASQMRLVIAGMVDDKSRDYLSYLRALAEGRDDVEFLACPSDTRLMELYDRAFAVLFTPPNEDWGIVPLEGMSYGKPVVAVNRGGPAESIVHGETGLLAADDPQSFASAMLALLDESLYERLSGRARKHAQQYDWSGFVDRIDEYLAGLASDAKQSEALAA
jgi:glycosyltransferase involved in cell wall biosynthesis